LRYHFVNTADFEAKKQRVHAEREEVVQRQKSNRDWQHVPRLTIPSDPTVDANATWWDWREQTDRELCSLPGDTVYVFDNARKVVYVYYGD
jgi:gentisate 1,2-dioxygenase